MKNTRKVFGLVIMAVFVFSIAACSGNSGGGGGGKSLNSAKALEEYLDSQPANSPDKPIKVTMSANEPMLKDIQKAINKAGKYVSLTLSGNVLTAIPDYAFNKCSNLVDITIPNSVISIRDSAFRACTSLTRVTFQGVITSDNLHSGAFGRRDMYNIEYSIGDLRDKYLGGGAGTYTRNAPLDYKSVWTKQ